MRQLITTPLLVLCAACSSGEVIDVPTVEVEMDGSGSSNANGNSNANANSNSNANANANANAGSGTAERINECDSPASEWVFCDDFETDRQDSYFEVDDADGAFERTAGSGVDDSVGMRVVFDAGQVSAGFLHLAIGRTPQSYFRPADDGTRDYRDLYWRVFVRVDEGWTGGGGHKLSRAFVFASPDSWAQAMMAHVWSSGPEHHHLAIDPATGTSDDGTLVTTKWNDFENRRFLGIDLSDTPIWSDDRSGRWYCIEARARLNDADDTNGVFQLWVDGTLEAERTGLNWLGAFDDYGINAVYLENYWNGGAPERQGRTFDNFVVSTAPIGCPAE